MHEVANEWSFTLVITVVTPIGSHLRLVCLSAVLEQHYHGEHEADMAAQVMDYLLRAAVDS